MFTGAVSSSRSAVFALLGAAAFAGAQASLFVVAGGPLRDGPGWFLNSAHNIQVVAGTVAVVAALASLAARHNAVWSALAVAGGATLAMAIALFATGAGSIFPIVLVIGGTIIAAAVAVGALCGGAIRLLAVWATDRRPGA